MSDAVIKTEGLDKVYKDFWGRPRLHALRGLSIETLRGEVFGIIGPNGSGKTTTMKLLLGLLRPTGGRARVLDRPPTDVEVKRRIGFLPEESYLYPFLTGDETLDFYGKIFGIPQAKRKKKIDELLGLFDMKDARRRQLKEYSKGMVRRISFAQALINDPEVVFLDEPTSGLDPISSIQIKRIIEELKNKGTTVFLSSHLLADVQSVCDRIAILDRGELKVYGPVKEILTRKDHVSLTFRNLSPEAGAAMVKAAEQAGATLVRSENTLETLEDVFIRTVGLDKKPKFPDAPPPDGDPKKS